MNLKNLSRPLIVGSLLGNTSLRPQLSLSKYIDLLEIRLDSFPPHSLQNAKFLLKKLKHQSKKPFLLTIRSPKEGGLFKKKKFKLLDRWNLFKPLIPSVDCVDVEIQEKELAKKVTALAHRKNKKVIHSYHDFKTRGNRTKICDLSKRSLHLKGDIFKLAVSIKNKNELYAFLKDGMFLPNPHRVLIGMGKQGIMSRYLGFTFGSLLTYGHLGRSAAPGQVSVRDLRKSMDKIYGSEIRAY